MKINNINIKGFKNLIDCKLSIQDFNVIIGSNNSGKSNLLEIFQFVDTVITGGDFEKTLLFHGEYGARGSYKCKIHDHTDDPIVIDFIFEDNIDGEDYKYYYYLDIKIGELFENQGAIQHEYFKYKKANTPGNPKTVFERKRNSIEKMTNQRIQSIDITESMLSVINKIKDIKDDLEPAAIRGINYIYMICKTPVLYGSATDIRESFKENKLVKKNGRIVSLPLTNEIDRILHSDDKQKFLDILDDILNIKKIEIVKISSDIKHLIIKYAHQEIQEGSNIDNFWIYTPPTSLEELSDGTIIVLNLIVYLLSNKYPIICIEELENSIHPRLLEKLIRLIKSNFSHVQIFITTHSPILLNIVQIDEVSIIYNDSHGIAKVEQVKNKKDLVKKLSAPFASFGDIFYEMYETEE